MALRTRSLLSLTVVSGRPTRVRWGRPLARWVSTLTAGACTPTWARLWTRASDMDAPLSLKKAASCGWVKDSDGGHDRRNKCASWFCRAGFFPVFS